MNERAIQPTGNAATAGEAIVRAADLGKVYSLGATDVEVLRGLNLSVKRGTFTLVVGPSGCGKSTLLHLLGLLDEPTSGAVYHGDTDAFAQPRRWRDRVRNCRVGFVFQFYHLLPELTVEENVLLPEMIRRSGLQWLRSRRACRDRARELLDNLGLGDRRTFKPTRLSGGERQRAAVARALVADPELVLADEPTGNLDTRAGWRIFELLRNLAIERGKTVVMVTHDNRFIPEAERVLHLAGGRIVDAETAARLAAEHDRKG